MSEGKKYRVVSLDWTPNPNAFKLLLDEKITAGASFHFTPDHFDSSWQLSKDLVAIEGVESVFFKDNFVTLTQKEGADMRSIHDAALKLINDTTVILESDLAQGEDLSSAASSQLMADFESKSKEEKLAAIDALLDAEIRPALAMDGGGLTLVDLEDNQLKVNYQGACGTCPSAAAGTLNFINQLIQNKVSPEITVVMA